MSTASLPLRAAPAEEARSGPAHRRAWWPWAVVAAAMVVAALHDIALWDRYAVGSFDDDANYILTARALLDGAGLTGHLVSGDSVVGGYPPGFPLLLVPVEWVFHQSYLALRLASVVSYLAVIPLTWHYLGRRAYPVAVRIAAVGLLALNPVLATFSVMVMAEMPFLLCSLLLLLAVSRWERSERVVDPTGLAVVLLAGGAIWLKEAGFGLVAGIVLWLLLRRQGRRALAVAVAIVVEMSPVLFARIIGGVPLAGARYSSELGGYYGGGLAGRLLHVLPSAAVAYVRTALPRSVLPFGSPFPQTHHWMAVWAALGIVTSALVLVGAVTAVVRYRDVAVVAIPVYVLETLFWPEINERRVVLVLPVLLAWFALGVATSGRLLGVGALRLLARIQLARRRPSHPPARVVRQATAVVASALAVVAIGLPLTAQVPRDYLFADHQDSSRPDGSRYMLALAALGPPTSVVETDYRYTTALFTGHRTAWNAFQNIQNIGCDQTIIDSSLAGDDAGFLLLGDLNKPNAIDNPCLLAWASTSPARAVRLLRTSRDRASVFELIGPGSGHPDLRDLTLDAATSGSDGLLDVAVAPSAAADVPGSALQTFATHGRGRISWTWGSPQPVAQVSVGEAGLLSGLAHGVALQILLPGGHWETVAYAATAVGDQAHHAPFLLATLPAGTRASGVRVVIHGEGPVVALDVHALGSTAS